MRGSRHCDTAHTMMKSARASQLSGKHAGHGIQLRVGAKNGRRALLVVAISGEGPSDRRESRRLRNVAEEAARVARRQERQKRADARQRVEDGAARKASMPGLAFTIAITAGVVKVAEVCQLLNGLVFLSTIDSEI